MFGGGRYFYTIFMCHLSIEKVLKGFYSQKSGETPPKTHNLLYLVEIIGLEFPDELYDFVFTINRVSVPTRYPDDLQRILEDYTKERTEDILKRSKVAV